MVQWDPSHQDSRRMKQREGTEGMVCLFFHSEVWSWRGVFGFWDPEQLDEVGDTLDHGRGIVTRPSLCSLPGQTVL